MTVEIRGTVTEIGLLETINENLNKKKVTVEVTEVGSEKYYINHYIVEFVNKNISLLDNVSVGDEVNCVCNLRGKRTSTNKVFMSLECFKLK